MKCYFDKKIDVLPLTILILSLILCLPVPSLQVGPSNAPDMDVVHTIYQRSRHIHLISLNHHVSLITHKLHRNPNIVNIRILIAAVILPHVNAFPQNLLQHHLLSPTFLDLKIKLLMLNERRYCYPLI